MRMENELLIEAPVEKVWQLTADVESWPRVTPTMTSVERLDDGPLGVGSRARVKQPGQRAAVWTVSAFEPNRLFEWGTTVLGVRMTGRHELAEVDGRTRNTLVLDVTGRGSGLLTKLIGAKMGQSIATENAGFKQHAEAATAQP
jgi:uncharacterized membrane protein